jgi:hypothetical protein
VSSGGRQASGGSHRSRTAARQVAGWPRSPATAARARQGSVVADARQASWYGQSAQLGIRDSAAIRSLGYFATELCPGGVAAVMHHLIDVAIFKRKIDIR